MEACYDEYVILEERLRTLLPESYRETYEAVQPVSMGSAGLKYGPDGRVAWDEIWASFCHLAMAGGPPHRGTLLQPAKREEIALDRKQYRAVVAELCRGVEMVSGLAAMPSRYSGWIDVDCPNVAMAGWLARAINMENVSAHVDGMVLRLPAGPAFRLQKEIKNVVVAIAKTCHYWVGHTSVAQHRKIADLFHSMEPETPLVQPPFPGRRSERLRDRVAQKIVAATGLSAKGREYVGWLGVDCTSVTAAVWMMRLVVASNVLCRREGTLIYVPMNPVTDKNGARVTDTVAQVHRMAQMQGFFRTSSGVLSDVPKHQDAVQL